MKKAFTVLSFLLVSFFVFAGTSYRSLSMGKIKSAVSSENLCNFENPALVYFAEKNNRMSVNTYWNAEVDGEYPMTKTAGFGVDFLGKNIFLGFDLDGYPVKQSDGLYNLYRDFDFDAKLAMGHGSFSLGAGFNGGSTSLRDGIELKDRFFSGIVSEAFFTRYKRESNSYKIELSVGASYKYKGFALGLLCENIFEDSSVSKFEVTKDSVLKDLDCGLYWTRERYGKRGRLNRNIFSFGLEMQKIRSEERSLNAGFEYMYQISREFNAAVRLGTEYVFSDSLSSLQTAGLSVGFKKGEVSLVCTAPYGIYYSKDFTEINYILVLDLVF